ncbi:MAG TPA: chemotaxis response regulator protein-glutamate methylesterase [Candidatus Acidoferrales bacterium]|nr:chemotaxis response regulator protein-glutamate methylesterase [Candidatus Acidoferrales bacterium]
MSPAHTKKVRVLIVDDSTFMRKVLQDIIASDAEMQVAGQAKDGREAVVMAESLKPDVIAMDINMPHMDGLQASELIMASNPRPIVIVSSESREGADSTLRALELGAIEFVAKPSSGVDLDMNNVREDLLRKLKMAAKVRVVRTASRPKSHVAQNAGKNSGAQAAPKIAPPDMRFPVVVLAASTGGPATVMRLAPGFTKDFPAAVILVQHMPASFTSQFALQLSEFTNIRVKDAEHNEALLPGCLYVCPGSHHLRVTPTGRIQLDNSGRIGGYLPRIDVTMETVAAYAGAMTIGAVLTGMGNDGVKGVQAIKAAGGLVIAQDEASCVIFGMPAEAIKTGAVDHVLNIDDIYPAIEKRVLGICRATPIGAR